MTEDSRAALAAIANRLDGSDVVVRLRVNGPVRIGPGAMVNAPIEVEGQCRGSADGVTVAVQTTVQTQGGEVSAVGYVLLDDVLTLVEMGSVTRPRIVT